MLRGTLLYADGENTYKYNLECADNMLTFSGRITSSSYNALQFLETGTSSEQMFGKGVCEEVFLERRRFDVGATNCKIETLVLEDEEKGIAPFKWVPNTTFFVKLATLIRYIKNNCSHKNEEGYTGLAEATDDFFASVTTRYKVPLSDSAYARVRLDMGYIKSIHFNFNGYTLDLEDEFVAYPEPFGKIETNVLCGLSFTKEYLGFEIVHKFKPVIDEYTTSLMYESLQEIIDANPDKDFAWLREKKYEIVTDDTLDEICASIRNHDGLIYFDTETTGLTFNFKCEVGEGDKLVGIILSYKYGESYYFPVRMKRIKNLCNGDDVYFMEHYMKPILEGKNLVVHNLEFDWRVCYVYGINANIVHDTMLLFKVTLGSERPDMTIKLKELTRQILKRDSLELSDLVKTDKWGESDITFDDLSEELTRLYACPDTDNLIGLLDFATKNNLLQRYNATKVYQIEINFTYAVAYQEYYGHLVDLKRLEQLKAEVTEGIANCMAKMEEIAGHKFNPNSSPQLLKIMYDELMIPAQYDRQSGRRTTSKDALKYLAELTDVEGNVKYPFVKWLQEYRVYEAVRKVIDAFPTLITKDGYLFSKVDQFKSTGRVSVKDPNYQSYNDTMKKYIVPRPGYYMTDQDYSSVESRILVSIVGNTETVEAFKDPDFDYHRSRASRMFSVPYEAVTSALRKQSKGVNFGLFYGMADPSLGCHIFGEETPENTKKAAALRAKYFVGMEDVERAMERWRNDSVANGYTSTYFGRRRYYDRNKFSKSKIKRQGGNQVIQGCYSGDGIVQDKVLGLCKLKDLDGQCVEVWDGQEWTCGYACYSGKKRKCIVKFAGGNTSICSPDHKFLVRSHKGNDRFVRCEDLIALYGRDGKVHKNAHRVVINQEYIPSETEYSSEDFRCEFTSSVRNANNHFIDDLSCSSFKKGVVLGRIASDGNYPYSSDNDHSGVEAIVAEHEFSIAKKLMQYMTEWGVASDIEDNPREGRTERLCKIHTYSRSLIRELQSLDIRHSIDPRIWADTEMLRGFLCGFFDGDGGVSGKTITLVQGTQYDFEPMFKDIQRALTHFGIRSRYRKYDNRHVLQIKTTDNEMFLERIGFLNDEKQAKASQLECKEDEHIFGKCLLVESVEITDEYIDMYDICNTERGYYVVDGIVTHNTAADIYKMAVGNLFKRICKEGWLGKVIFTAFVHDELLSEVSTDIHPSDWLRVSQEEFQVKIEGWCPLYMGFGYGDNWYQAKKTEIPIQLQYKMIEDFRGTGLDWDGIPSDFCKQLPKCIDDFTKSSVDEYLVDSSNYGGYMKTSIYSSMMDILSDTLGKGNVPKALDDMIAKYCEIRGISVPAGSFIEAKLDGNGADIGADNLVNTSFNMGDDEEEISMAEKQRVRDLRIETLGLYLDIDEKTVYLKLVPKYFLDIIKGRTNMEGVGYNIVFVDSVKKTNYTTKSYLDSGSIEDIQSMYITYMNQISV